MKNHLIIDLRLQKGSKIDQVMVLTAHFIQADMDVNWLINFFHSNELRKDI